MRGYRRRHRASRSRLSPDLQPHLRGKQLKGEIHRGGLTIHGFQIGVLERRREQSDHDVQGSSASAEPTLLITQEGAC